MIAVFREVRRVLRDDGVVWLNYGDTYHGGGSRGGSVKQQSNKGSWHDNVNGKTGLPPGNLCGVPWRVALSLQADGWILRSDIPWVKRSSMPESVNSRPAKSLEYVFQLTKSMDYYYDPIAVRRKGSTEYRSTDFIPDSEKDSSNNGIATAATAASRANRSPDLVSGRNFRNSDLWFESVEGAHGLTGVGEELVGLDVVSQSYEGSHFAVFGTNLIRPLLLCSTSEYGACAKCGSPYRRILEEKKLTRERPNDYVKRKGEEGTGNSCANSVAGVESRTVGWKPTCTCFGRFEKRKDKSKRKFALNAPGWAGSQSIAPISDAGELSEEVSKTLIEYIPDIPLNDHPVRPCIVLDPFMGSGTTAIVAIEHGRWAWGIDLSREYLTNHAVKRVQGELLSRPALAHLAGLGSPKVVGGGREI